MATKVKRKCKQCGKEFFIIPSKAMKGRGKFCSIKCRREYGKIRRSKVKKVCEYCGKIFYAPYPQVEKGKGNFCSRKCLTDYQKGIRIKKVCQFCGKVFYIIPARQRASGKFAGKYCSRECSDKGRAGSGSTRWQGDNIKRVCKTCGKIFFVRPSKLKNSRGKFCSRRCNSIYVMKHMKMENTSIELAMEAEFIKQHIPYMKQAPVEGIALVDFLLPDNIVVQCDGDYWHSPQEVKDKDNNQDFLLGFKGYKIFRFSETEINKSTKKCVKKILQGYQTH